MSRIASRAGIIIGTLVVSACQIAAHGPMSPSAATGASTEARSGGTTVKLLGDVVAGDASFAAEDAAPLASTCPTQAGNTWSLDFGHTLFELGAVGTFS